MKSPLPESTTKASRPRWTSSLQFLAGLPALFLLHSCAETREDALTVAVASNFVNAARQIVESFRAETGIKVILVSGSTGKLTAQIQQGAPFDVFLSADRESPGRLVEDGIAVPGTRFTYAMGQLALYSRTDSFVDEKGEVLNTAEFSHLAIANPKLAPYGRAAQECLISLGLLDRVQNRIAYGENIAQTFHFVESGNAELGFVALPQTLNLTGGSTWQLPSYLHSPIEQDAILLQDTVAGRRFLTFLQSDPARHIVKKNGYLLPPSLHVE
ncbi:MAG: molybdate ABC transporter substrate-binding protein [Verrucomicrobiales bacterium]|nr:molybdate ABC transporter substrate-binding protein [Verrucomicrobiales bacterium]